MKSKPIYLDYAATTPVAPEVLGAMLPFYAENYGNPSSLHSQGRKTRKALAQARQKVARCLGAEPQEIVFTASGTEANNLAILGVARSLSEKGCHIITSSIEHSAVLKTCRSLEDEGWDVTYLPVDDEGFVSLDDLEAAIRLDTVLVSIMHGNNEVGTIQPIEKIGKFLRKKKILFHTDAIQTVGKVHLNLSELPVDYLSVSAHKIYGPKGVGALYIRDGAPKPQPLVYGGGQETGLRSGTENLAGIVGLAKALEIATGMIDGERKRLHKLQRFLIETMETTAKNLGFAALLNGPQDLEKRIPGNVHFSFPPAEGESLVLKLDLRNIAVSSGSACHSAVIEPSHVVLALGRSREVASATVRIAMGRDTIRDDLEALVNALCHILVRKRQPVKR